MTVRRGHSTKGYVEQIILRVPAFVQPGQDIDSAKLPVHIEHDRGHLTVQLYVEHVSDNISGHVAQRIFIVT